jgi:predicted nucleotidyltransferase
MKNIFCSLSLLVTHHANFVRKEKSKSPKIYTQQQVKTFAYEDDCSHLMQHVEKFARQKVQKSREEHGLYGIPWKTTDF